MADLHEECPDCGERWEDCQCDDDFDEPWNTPSAVDVDDAIAIEVGKRLAGRRSDAAFQGRLAKLINDNKTILDRLT